MSASSTPIFKPSRARPSARLQAVVDLPTPPFPEATAIMCLMPGIALLSAALPRWPCALAPICFCCLGTLLRSVSAVRVTSAEPTPGMALIAASASARMLSSAPASSGPTAIATKTLSFRTLTPDTAPDSGSGVLPSGPATAASAVRTSSFVSMPPSILPVQPVRDPSPLWCRRSRVHRSVRSPCCTLARTN